MDSLLVRGTKLEISLHAENWPVLKLRPRKRPLTAYVTSEPPGGKGIAAEFFRSIPRLWAKSALAIEFRRLQ
jgi:hypothetical protein